MPRPVSARFAALALLFAACDDGPAGPAGGDGFDAAPAGDATPASDGDAVDRAQVPPRGHAAVIAWLAEGHYLTWACEEAPHPARPPGAHGRNRICSNTALAGSAAGTFPVGAASVKELHDGGGITGYAVGLKLTAGTDRASWYWYESIGDQVVADGAGVSLCAGCHEDAPRDHVFTQVR
jgi:hypothetical protein